MQTAIVLHSFTFVTNLIYQHSFPITLRQKLKFHFVPVFAVLNGKYRNVHFFAIYHMNPISQRSWQQKSTICVYLLDEKQRFINHRDRNELENSFSCSASCRKWLPGHCHKVDHQTKMHILGFTSPVIQISLPNVLRTLICHQKKRVA